MRTAGISPADKADPLFKELGVFISPWQLGGKAFLG